MSESTPKHHRPFRGFWIEADEAKGSEEPSMFDQPGAVELPAEQLGINDIFDPDSQDPEKNWNTWPRGAQIAIPGLRQQQAHAALQAHAKKIEQIKVDLINAPAPLPFTGQVELFFDRDVWNVSLSGGGLARPLRFQPGKDSSNARHLHRLVRRTHLSQWVEHSDTESICQDMALFSRVELEEEAIVVSFIQRVTQMHLGSARISIKSKVFIETKQMRRDLDADQRAQVRQVLQTYAAGIVASVPEAQGKAISWVGDYFEPTLRPQVSASFVEEGAFGQTLFGQILLPQGSDIGHLSLTSMSATGPKMYQAWVLIHPRESLVLSAGQMPMGAKMHTMIHSALGERGVNTAFSVREADTSDAIGLREIAAQAHHLADRSIGYLKVERRVGDTIETSETIFVLAEGVYYLVSTATSLKAKKAVETVFIELGITSKQPRLVTAQELPNLFG